MMDLGSIIKKNNQHNSKFNNNKGGVRKNNFNRNRNREAGEGVDGGEWGHDGFQEDDDVEMAVDGADHHHHHQGGKKKVSGTAAGPEPYLAAITNLHWNVSESDLKELFGPDSLVSLKLNYDNAGRSLGVAVAIFKSKALATQAQENFNGELLDGKELQIELQGPHVVKKKPVHQQSQKKGKKGGIESRLGPSIFDRLAPKLEDRLGKKLDDRLGNKGQAGRKDNASTKKLKNIDVEKVRQIKSYADLA